MGFLSKQIGVLIMEKFKIYVHHYYTYELFWLFFHGIEIDYKSVPTWFNNFNRYNKNIKVEKEVSLSGIYKSKEIQIIFCYDKNWDKSDGYHLFDYSIDLLERNSVADRGFNCNLMTEVNRRNVKFLNKKAESLGEKIHFFYIDWEGHDPFVMEGWYKNLNSNIHLFLDEEFSNIKNLYNHHFSFTNLIWSFIYPNTLGVRDYYFFHDYLKYKNDYKYKINIPIRRLYGDKERLAKEVIKLNNKDISVTVSSFGDENQVVPDYVKQSPLRDKIIENIPTDNFIQKRGYGINDWGGEWNSNNMNENMWKMFGISEACILFEHSPKHDRKTYGREKLSRVGENFITEKSISHILVGKPFIPYYYDTILFYDKWLKYYGKKTVEFPLKYDFILHKLDYIDTLTKNPTEWNSFLDKLEKYVLNLRTQIVELIHENNSYLDYVISDSNPRSFI